MCRFSLYFFVNQNTAYESRRRDWISDLCSSDLGEVLLGLHPVQPRQWAPRQPWAVAILSRIVAAIGGDGEEAAGAGQGGEAVLAVAGDHRVMQRPNPEIGRAHV